MKRLTINEKQAANLVLWVQWTKEDMERRERRYQYNCSIGASDGDPNAFKELIDSVLELVGSLA
jgi:hypothetical protein